MFSDLAIISAALLGEVNFGQSTASCLNVEQPENSNNGILTAQEAKSLNLKNTELVVLSACETGLGKIYGGEGVVGLAQAFFIAGANSLSVSLWQVDEESTAIFMSKLYEKSKSGSYNICSGQPISVRNLVEARRLEKRSKIDLNFGYYPYSSLEPMAFWGIKDIE